MLWKKWRREKLTVFCDAAVHVRAHATGLAAVMLNAHGQLRAWWSLRLPLMTNNEAEWEAVFRALLWVREFYPQQLLVCSDNTVVVNPLQGRATLRSIPLQEAANRVRTAIQALDIPVTFCWVPRTRNQLAHAFAFEAAEGRVHHGMAR